MNGSEWVSKKSNWTSAVQMGIKIQYVVQSVNSFRNMISYL